MRNHTAFLIITVTVFAALGPPAAGQSGRRSSREMPQGQQKPARTGPPATRPSPPEQKEPKEESIRVSTDLVTVVTSVAGPAGAAAPLRREDFEVLEDGVPQEISAFARDNDVPLRLVMLFDTSSSVAPQIGFERRAAGRFFERVMRPQDQAALYSVATEVVVMQDFTGRVSLLTGAAKQLRAKGATSLYDGIFLAAEQLSSLPGRHIIVIVSDGGDTTSGKNLKEALAAAQQADAVIFAIFSGTRSPSQNVRDLAAEGALATLTGETGGETFYPRPLRGDYDEGSEDQELKLLDAAFARLADQLRTQYTLGFYSGNEARDGRFRRLTVRIRKAGYTARARAGYYAPKS
ncbi:MAG TPA: VWA domain-containing protein [Blastocatellia bacterium]|nr:VWA domain-containing protein [Blastocatellia bacterium]